MEGQPRYRVRFYPMVPPPQRVQDDLREQQLVLALRLERGGRRIGSDAHDENGNLYELKSVTTENVTTGRDVGLPFLDRMRGRYWIIAHGRQDAFGFAIDGVYFLSPAMLEEWIAPIEARIHRDMALMEDAIAVLQEAEFRGDLNRLRALCQRGLTINNPKIGMGYVRLHGILLADPLAIHMRELVAMNPITPTV